MRPATLQKVVAVPACAECAIPAGYIGEGDVLGRQSKRQRELTAERAAVVVAAKAPRIGDGIEAEGTPVEAQPRPDRDVEQCVVVFTIAVTSAVSTGSEKSDQDRQRPAGDSCLGRQRRDPTPDLRTFASARVKGRPLTFTTRDAGPWLMLVVGASIK
jgi:hypothetical protein